MIVQAADGRYYRNPIVEVDNWLLECNEDGSFIKREGFVTWATARKFLPGGGIKCRYEATAKPGTSIVKGRIVDVSVFRVTLRGAIPIPTSHNGMLILRPSHSDLENADESLLAWQE